MGRVGREEGRGRERERKKVLSKGLLLPRHSSRDSAALLLWTWRTHAGVSTCQVMAEHGPPIPREHVSVDEACLLLHHVLVQKSSVAQWVLYLSAGARKTHRRSPAL